MQNVILNNNNAIIYTRCSTKKQNNITFNSASLETQKNACTLYCTNNNLNILENVREICFIRMPARCEQRQLHRRHTLRVL